MGQMINRRRSMMRGSVAKNYIVFDDPVVETLCIEAFSKDGIGVTYEDAAAVKDLSSGPKGTNIFRRNTSITKFNELQFFTGLTTLQSNTSAGGYFQESTIEEIILPAPQDNATGIDNFYHCTSLKKVKVEEGITTVSQHSFSRLSSFCIVDLPSTITTINANGFYYFSGVLVVRAATPPTGSVSTPSEIYVPDASVNLYQTTWSSLSSKIKPLSEYVEPTNE